MDAVTGGSTSTEQWRLERQKMIVDFACNFTHERSGSMLKNSRPAILTDAMGIHHPSPGSTSDLANVVVVLVK